MARPPRPRRDTVEDSATLLATLTALLAADKTLAPPISWVEDEDHLWYAGANIMAGTHRCSV